MKTNLQGTQTVPALGFLTNCKIKLIAFLNAILPADCQIQTSRDGYIVATIFLFCLSLIFYPLFIGVAYCAVKADLFKKGDSHE